MLTNKSRIVDFLFQARKYATLAGSIWLPRPFPKRAFNSSGKPSPKDTMGALSG